MPDEMQLDSVVHRLADTIPTVVRAEIDSVTVAEIINETIAETVAVANLRITALVRLATYLVLLEEHLYSINQTNESIDHQETTSALPKM